MTQLYQVLNKAAPVAGDFGIEVEVEGRNLVVINNEVWKTERDGSLRGEAQEYILTKPLPRNKIRKALDLLSHRLRNAELNFSSRTSVHVHMNMTDCSYNQILNTVYTYLLLEEPLVTYCGKARRGNRFCLRLQDAEGIMDILTFLFKGKIEDILRIPHDNIRYASINLESLQKYGSLEFRAMKGTLDPETLDTWVEAIHRIKEFSKNVESPIDIYNLYLQKTSKQFIDTVLGDISDKFYYPRINNDMSRSFSLSIDLPYTFKSRKKTDSTSKTSLPYSDPIIEPRLAAAFLRDPRPVPVLLDRRGNQFKIGDIVVIDRFAEENDIWVEQMNEYVDDRKQYRLQNIYEDPPRIVLDHNEFVWPPESLMIIRRGD